MLSINDVFTHYGIASLPFGGEGLSGFGRLHGMEGLRALSRTKSVVRNRFNFISDPWWFNRSKRVEKFLNTFLKLMNSSHFSNYKYQIYSDVPLQKD